MSNTVIAEGKTTAEAIENGLKQLKVSKNDVDVTVLKDENKKSFFNILAPRTVRVELKLKEKHNENKNIKKVEENELSEEEFNVIKNNISNFLDKFLKQINEENTKFEIVRDENIVNLNINGENLNSLIGYRGETLNALQTLISRIGNKGLEKRHRIIVDIEGYRNKRIKALQDLAVKVSKTVMKNKKSIKLEPMSAFERKIIHDKLQENPKVTTHSVGKEPNRKVVIEIKK
jgi:spoIIIJ-associated protein